MELLKVAIVHYWLVNMRGGEKVVEALCELFPDADIFTHVYDPSAISDKINRHNIRTTFIQKLPGATHHYQKYLPFMPLALEQLDLRNYDIVISSESGPSKGVLVSPDTMHICYCHTPMRYIWNMYHEYRLSLSVLGQKIWAVISSFIRQWDYMNSQRVDHFIANSYNVQQRIRRYYGRESEVIYPPLDFSRFSVNKSEDFYLFVGQLNPYKKADLAVRAFNRCNKKLIVIGDGSQKRYLEKIAGTNISLLGKLPDLAVADYYSRCKALIFPGEEDFGITPLEAMASGRPVIAYGKGGALETVIDGKTGVFFHNQNESSLINAIEEAENNHWDVDYLRKYAKQFDTAITKKRLQSFIEEKYKSFQNSLKKNTQSRQGH